MDSMEIFKQMTDDEIFAAAENLDDYNAHGQQAILAEVERRRSRAEEEKIREKPQQERHQSENSNDHTQDWECSKCGEVVEGNFDACWSCGAKKSGSSPAKSPEGGENVVKAASPKLSGSARPSSGGGKKPLYEYKVVPFVGELKSGVFGSVEEAGAVSLQLEKLIAKYANQGWEFVTINDVNIEIKPGCLAGIFGAKTSFMHLDQVVFKRSLG